MFLIYIKSQKARGKLVYVIEQLWENDIHKTQLTLFFSTPIPHPSSGWEIFNISVPVCPHISEGRMRKIDLVHSHEPSISPLYMC